jgi:hypothetical protein
MHRAEQGQAYELSGCLRWNKEIYNTCDRILYSIDTTGKNLSTLAFIDLQYQFPPLNA